MVLHNNQLSESLTRTSKSGGQAVGCSWNARLRTLVIAYEGELTRSDGDSGSIDRLLKLTAQSLMALLMISRLLDKRQARKAAGLPRSRKQKRQSAFLNTMFDTLNKARLNLSEQLALPKELPLAEMFYLAFPGLSKVQATQDAVCIQTLIAAARP